MTDDRKPGGDPATSKHDLPTKTDAGTGAPAPLGPMPETIGPYRILGRLGEGGMGVVYEAEQESPRRRVALKVMRGGHVVDEVHARMFQREAETLARLKHPNIGGIYEAGHTRDPETGAGQDYFAMELVRGDTLDEWLRKRSGPLNDDELDLRLRLFRKICDAVHYAHQKGVIHRDLKPSNIIIGEDLSAAESTAGTDASLSPLPEVKILDFGLARITDTDVQVTRITEIGVLKGTLAYMSPEQTRGNPDEIDLRSDVYGLGIILYEMLSGERPYDVLDRALVEAVRVICETPPEPLRLKSAELRRMDPDVETIVGKALEKEPDRRYASAAALSEDIGRYLASQPILARPPSAAYQIKKLVARNRGMAAAMGALLLVVVAGAVISTTLYFRAESARAEAESERDRANVEAASAQRVTDFLIGMFEQSDPAESLGETITAREILDRGAESIDELNDQPRVQARLMTAMGEVHNNLGLHDSAIGILERAYQTARDELGDDHPETIASALALADVMILLERYDEAGPLIENAVEVRERTLGARHPDTLDAKHRLAAFYCETDGCEAGMELQREVLEVQLELLGDRHEQTMSSMSTMAAMLAGTGDVVTGTEWRERLLEAQLEVLGEEHPNTLHNMTQLATYLSVIDRYDEAEAMYIRALAVQRKVLGDEHMDTLFTIGNLATEYLDRGRVDEAAPLLFELRAEFARQFGEEHFFTRLSDYHVGRVHNAREQWAEALACFERALVGTWDSDDFQSVTQRIDYAVTLTGLGRYQEAEQFLLASHALVDARDGDEREIFLARAKEALVGLYEAWGRPEESAKWK
jgi:serine/threonine protein kinase